MTGRLVVLTRIPLWSRYRLPTPPAALPPTVWTRLLDSAVRMPESELEHYLHEAVRKNVDDLHASNFRIMRIEPIRRDDGTVEYYDVSIKP